MYGAFDFKKKEKEQKKKKKKRHLRTHKSHVQ